MKERKTFFHLNLVKLFRVMRKILIIKWLADNSVLDRYNFKIQYPKKNRETRAGIRY